MSTITINLPAARTVAAPRGAVLAATWFARAANWLISAPQRQPLTVAQQADGLRRLAYSLRHSDARAADELLAAAARHEGLVA
jgi:hypothetical protein